MSLFPIAWEQEAAICYAHLPRLARGVESEMRRFRRVMLSLVIILAVVYVSFATYVFWVMHQSPEVIGRTMAKMPDPIVFMLVPFEALWDRARAGALKPGDSAPDFSLQTLDKSESIQLSALNKQRPVVLIFGSYT